MNPIIKDIWLTRLALAIWILAALAFIVLLVTNLLAVVPPFTSLTLAWNNTASSGTNIGYVLKWGPLPGATNFNLFVGTNLTAVVTNPTTGFLYFHVVARTSDGIESEPSNTIKETNYPSAPIQLRIRTNTTTSLKLEGSVDGGAWIHLATITNDPVWVAMRRNMMLRTSTNLPPVPK
jgi:hypothetical protein